MPRPGVEPRSPRGLIDTSVVIDLPDIELNRLPVEIAISAVTLAELAAGPHATSDSAERAKRQDRLQRAEATFEPLPVDASVARAYACPAAIVALGTRHAAVGSRFLDRGDSCRGRSATLHRNPTTSAPASLSHCPDSI